MTCITPVDRKLWCIWLLALPAALTAWFIHSYGVGLLINDSWDLAPTFIAWHQRGPQWHEVFQFHTEHRIALPRLLFFALAETVGWNARAEMWLGWGFAVATAVLLARHFVQARLEWPVKAALVLGATATVFNWSQWQNWLWGFQMSWFMLVAMLAGGAGLAASIGCNSVGRVVALVALCAAATVTLANGVLFWPILGAVAVWSARQHGRLHGWRTSLAMALSGACAIALFLHGYQRAPNQIGFIAIIEAPADVARFFFSLIGLSLTAPMFAIGGTWSTPHWVAVAAGVVLCMLLGGALFWQLRTRTWREPLNLLAWQFAGFGLVSALLITIGRLRLGSDFAFESRYVTFTQTVIWALLFMAASIATVGDGPNRWLPAVALSTICVFFFALGCHEHTPFARSLRMVHGRHHALMHLREALPVPAELSLIARQPDISRWSNTVDALEFHRLFRASEIKESVLPAACVLKPPSGLVLGHVDGLEATEAKVVLRGWARLADQPLPADIVVAAAHTAGGDYRLLTVSRAERTIRPDVVTTTKQDGLLLSGWTIELLPDTNTPASSIVVLSFMADTREFFLLSPPRP